jgi:ribosomal protein S18 acetylase RimI-like enzyme
MIKQILTLSEIKSSVKVIQDSFSTVANDFGLTIRNCPTNAAFIKEYDLLKMEEKGVDMFGLFERGSQIGFVALEKSSSDPALFYLEKLAVLPEHRSMGYGRLLMNFALDEVRKNDGKKISIGIINENLKLKKWYIDYGFIELAVKQYPHLPFDVCFLEKEV